MTDPDDRIGTYEAEVLRNLRAWMNERNRLTDAQTEVVRHIVDYPESHERDINAIVERGFSYVALQEALDASEPSTWGYPADAWATVARIHELRTRTVLDDEEAVVQALREQDHDRERIATMLGESPASVDDRCHRVDEQIDRARTTVELIGE